jgi:alpha-D-xyloside xylohydrolase
MQLHAGDGKAHACRYPLDHQRAFYEGMTAAGEEETLFLCRSAWAGSQRYGAAVWSGDIQSTFEVFGSQIRAGLNMAMSGIPWWNTDIGGFLHGDPQTDYFRELVVRWFQYGTFSPIMRLHGVREPAVDHRDSGAPNEVWSFGDAAYEILHRYIMIRERLRPYIHEQMQRASEHGTPLMRPLFLDFPGDSEAWDVDDAYMFGDDLLVAPVYVRGQSSRHVYLPGGEKWTHVWSGTEHTGGRTLQIDAPLEEIPIFVREGGQLRRDVILGG